MSSKKESKKEKKDTNHEPVDPHRPASVYQPNPFPLTPSEGNPWARSDSDLPYVPPHRTTVSGYSYDDSYDPRYRYSYDRTHDSSAGVSNATPYDQSYDRSYNDRNDRYSYDNRNDRYSYNNRNDGYSYNNRNDGYSHDNRDDRRSYNQRRNSYSGEDESKHHNLRKNRSSNKLNGGSKQPSTSESTESDSSKPDGSEETRVSQPVIKGGQSRKPNGKRLLLRFIQLLTSVGAFGFIAGAPSFSGHDIPFSDKSAVVCLYIISLCSAVVALFFLFNQCTRRMNKGKKMNRSVMILIDGFFGTVWGIDVIILIFYFNCTPGGYNHWCDFYNTSIFFGSVAFVSYVLSFFWDIIGCCRG